MTPITLTPETIGSIHVDSVDVSKGVYIKSSANLAFIVGNRDSCTVIYSIDRVRDTEKPLRTVLEAMNDQWEAYTLSGQRITLEKQLTIADLKDSDHVGFVDKSGEKGYVAYVNNGKYMLLDCGDKLLGECNTMWGFGGNSLIDALKSAESCDTYKQLAELYLFATRTGSEDSLFGWLNK